jgi:hypothetical protein
MRTRYNSSDVSLGLSESEKGRGFSVVTRVSSCNVIEGFDLKWN